MESKHTPGPWHISENGGGVFADIPLNDSNFVAEVYGPDAPANAALIAAAPELLAAALKVLDVAQPEPMSPLWAALYALREATNKAEAR